MARQSEWGEPVEVKGQEFAMLLGELVGFLDRHGWAFVDVARYYADLLPTETLYFIWNNYVSKKKIRKQDWKPGQQRRAMILDLLTGWFRTSQKATENAIGIFLRHLSVEDLRRGIQTLRAEYGNAF